MTTRPTVTHHHFAASEIEFNENSQTIWVRGANGITILRVKCTGRIIVDSLCNNLTAHCDVQAEGNIHFCIPPGQA